MLVVSSSSNLGRRGEVVVADNKSLETSQLEDKVCLLGLMALTIEKAFFVVLCLVETLRVGI